MRTPSGSFTRSFRLVGSWSRYNNSPRVQIKLKRPSFPTPLTTPVACPYTCTTRTLWSISGRKMSDSVTESSVVQDIPEGTSDSTEPWKEEWLSGPEGFQFYTRTYSVSPPTSPKAIILFVHGFAEHIGRYEHIHINYPKQGFTLFAYDQRGFGKTALDSEKKSKGSKYGKTSWKWQLGDIEWWIKYLVEKYAGVPVFLMGHSMVRGSL